MIATTTRILSFSQSKKRIFGLQSFKSGLYPPPFSSDSDFHLDSSVVHCREDGVHADLDDLPAGGDRRDLDHHRADAAAVQRGVAQDAGAQGADPGPAPAGSHPQTGDGFLATELVLQFSTYLIDKYSRLHTEGTWLKIF